MPTLRGITAERLARMHGLTPAESAVVLALLSGRRCTVIATDQGVSIHTIRSHMKHAMLKIGVHSQLELVAKLLSS